MRSSLGYWLFASYVRAGLRFYFRKMQHEGTENVPRKGPVLLLPNHQNAFLDALVVGAGLKRPTWFLARADVFRSPWAAKALHFLKVMPIFRFRDGHAAIRKNEQAIQNCVELLKEGQCLLLFPEGSHNEPYTLRDLQKGFAQIALMYLDQTGQDIPIIPVGIHFEEHQMFGTRVLVRYGKPLSVKQCVSGLEGRERFAPLLQRIKAQIEDMILRLPLDAEYKEKRDYLLRNRIRKRDLVEQLDADRDLAQLWNPGSADLPKRNFFPDGIKWLNPLYLYGRATHLLPEAIIARLVQRKIKDRQFVGSVKAAVGIFLIPAYYLLLCGCFLALTTNPLWTLAFAASLPLSGLFTYVYSR